MQTHYPSADYEREYLMERSIIEAEQEEEFQALIEPPFKETKIEVFNGEQQTTRIETGTEKFIYNQQVEIP